MSQCTYCATSNSMCACKSLNCKLTSPKATVCHRISTQPKQPGIDCLTRCIARCTTVYTSTGTYNVELISTQTSCPLGTCCQSSNMTSRSTTHAVYHAWCTMSHVYLAYNWPFTTRCYFIHEVEFPWPGATQDHAHILPDHQPHKQ
eukprot:scpid107885/ scgid7983/ 